MNKTMSSRGALSAGGNCKKVICYANEPQVLSITKEHYDRLASIKTKENCKKWIFESIASLFLAIFLFCLDKSIQTINWIWIVATCVCFIITIVCIFSRILISKDEGSNLVTLKQVMDEIKKRNQYILQNIEESTPLQNKKEDTNDEFDVEMLQ